MIKNYNWEISKEEISRILNLHENATKRHYIINEEGTPPTTPNESIEVPLNANWGDGKYILTPQQIDSISSGLKDIADYAIKNKNNIVTVKIEAGESQVTNRDNEMGGKVVEQGYLSAKRAESLYGYLSMYLKKLDLNNVKFLPYKFVPGKTKYSGPSDKTKFAAQYAAERFVKAIVSIEGGEDECLSNMKFIVEYDPKYCVKSDPNTGRPEIDPETKQPKQIEGGSRCHACSEALFSIFINGLPLKDKNGSNIANLNNNNISQAVKWEGFVSPDIVNQLKQTNAKELVFTYACANQNGCHSDAMNVTITVNGQIAFKDFVSGGVRLKPGDGQRLLLKTDLCGKVIEVGKRLGTQDLVAKKRPEGSVDFSSMKVGIEKHNIVYNAVDPNTKLIDPKKVFDPNFPGDAPSIRQWSINPKTWDQYKRQHSITPEMEKQIIDFKKENKS
jgi:hypothetical protein